MVYIARVEIKIFLYYMARVFQQIITYLILYCINVRCSMYVYT